MIKQNQRISRRGILALGTFLPALGLASRVTAQDACVDLNSESASQESLRQSLGYQIVSDDPKRTCSGCAFFSSSSSSPVAGAACGKCEMLNGGAVGAQSRCDSWAARK